MTSLVDRLRMAYAAVAAWPEARMPDGDVEDLGTGFLDLLKVRNLVPEVADRIEELERENAELRSMLANKRREALEEAAKIADDYECHLMSYGGSVDAQHFYEGGMLDAGQGIAIAIRALSDSTPTPLQEQNANMGKEGEPSVNSVESED